MTHATEEMAPEVAPELAAEASDARPAAAGGSTLIEFPGARSIPQWRKDLSERVREIQKRKAREAATEADGAASLPAVEPPGVAAADDAQTKEAQTREGSAASRLGLVPPLPDAPELNPLVAAALKRIERARQQPAARGAGTGGARAAGVAVARVAEEQYEARPRPQAEARGEAQQSPAAEAGPSPELTPAVAEAARPAALVAVPPPKTSADVKPAPKADAPELKTEASEAPAHASAEAVSVAAAPQAEEKAPTVAESESVARDRPAPRRVADGVIDDAWLSRLEERILPPVNAAARTTDDIAPLAPRLLAALIDLLLVVFLASPFAAVIELTNGNWADPRVAASMGGVAFVLMFLYLTVSTALAGRTWGMSLFKLHTVDAETALAPTTGQCVRRTLLYILSLAAFGLGILYALFDRERRAAHDHLSGTVVVRH